MQKIKVKIKRTGDPVKKVVKKVDSKKEEVIGVKPGEKDLPEVKVTGNRPDLNKVTIDSDEHKSKKWHLSKRKYGVEPTELPINTLKYTDVHSNYHETEDDYKKKPGAIGKVNVRYSDGTVKKLGEKYEPSKTYTTPVVEFKGGAGFPDQKTGGELKNKLGIVSEPESDKIGKSDWKEWHKSTYGQK
jgi:hypothetical protein